MHKVIFACVHNAGRSQMAAAFFNQLADGQNAQAISAGTEPGLRVHPDVLAVMQEVGLDLSNAKPQKLTDELSRGAQLLITMAHLSVRGVEITEAECRVRAASHLQWRKESQPVSADGVPVSWLQVCFSTSKGFSGAWCSDWCVRGASKSRFLADGDPPEVWPYAEGKVRGIAFAPLYKGAPKAALRDPKFYSVLALCDAVRGGRTRERNLAIELLGKEIDA